MVYEADEGKEDGLSGACLDDGGFAYTCGVEIDVGALFGRFGCDIEVEDFDYVADEVR